MTIASEQQHLRAIEEGGVSIPGTGLLPYDEAVGGVEADLMSHHDTVVALVAQTL